MVKIPEEKYLQLSENLYRSLIKRLEIFSGKEFTSKVITFSAYKSTKDFLNSKKVREEDVKKFMHTTIEKLTGGKIIKNDIKKESGGVVLLKDSAEAISYGPSETPVCNLTQGIMKAMAEQIIGKNVEVKERKCVAMGDDFCEFAIIVSG